MTKATEAGKSLSESFIAGDPVVALQNIVSYRQGMKDPATGAEFILWVTEPPNLTLLHTALIEHLGIPPKLLAIRRLSLSRTQKAVLLTQAMEIAIKKVHKL